MKEATSTRILGIYFSRVKAYAQSEALSSFEAVVYYIPNTIGYSPNDWKTVVNIMIEKKGKENQVGDLRTINLIEADFNFNNKIIAKEILLCTERN